MSPLGYEFVVFRNPPENPQGWVVRRKRRSDPRPVDCRDPLVMAAPTYLEVVRAIPQIHTLSRHDRAPNDHASVYEVWK
jgi:hypothetical protein